MPNPNLPNNPGYNLYVGARYVPIFSDVNNGVWTDSVAYEPLTIVTYLGDSYTSKTYVPVGIAPTNETYWAKTGNYNAQIETLNQKINSVEQSVSSLDGEVAQIDVELENLSNSTTQSVSNLSLEIDDVKSILPTKAHMLYGSKCLIVGDSLAVSGRWSTSFASASGAICTIAGNGSAGFTRGGNTSPWVGMNFTEMVKQVAGGLTAAEKLEFSHIVIGGGINDVTQTHTETEFANAAVSFVNACRINFPNAQLHYFFDSTFTRLNATGYQNSYAYLKEIFEKVFRKMGACVYDELSLICYGNPSWDSGDRVHMTPDGYSAYGEAISNAVNGGSISELKNIKNDFTFNPLFTLYNESYFTCSLDTIYANYTAVLHSEEAVSIPMSVGDKSPWNLLNGQFKNLTRNLPWHTGLAIVSGVYTPILFGSAGQIRTISGGQLTLNNNDQLWASFDIKLSYLGNFGNY